MVAAQVGGGKHAGGVSPATNQTFQSVPSGDDCSRELIAFNH